MSLGQYCFDDKAVSWNNIHVGVGLWCIVVCYFFLSCLVLRFPVLKDHKRILIQYKHIPTMFILLSIPVLIQILIIPRGSIHLRRAYSSATGDASCSMIWIESCCIKFFNNLHNNLLYNDLGSLAAINQAHILSMINDCINITLLEVHAHIRHIFNGGLIKVVKFLLKSKKKPWRSAFPLHLLVHVGCVILTKHQILHLE